MILTYKYRIKDRRTSRVLAGHAIAVNQVWNYCNALQCDIEMRYRAGAPKRRWPSHFDLVNLCKGAGKELGIHQHTVQNVCQQFTIDRDRTKRSLRFRSSFGTRRTLGWIPFQKQSRQTEGN